MPSQQKSRIKVTDGHGLYLLIKPNGGKYWRLDYAIDSKRKTLAIGVYPRISLAEARESAEKRSPYDCNRARPPQHSQATDQTRDRLPC
ncbi:Arm DNA-binding domain-containing protein [Neisseria sp.]|uniref:Arm DNA-binding domain-containing protein n=1 Tax=Neisseria sp. TaxID=192066 RepID=UPI00289980E3|nr:Arm DNA-binding domain-containing protein [Neisseria sp.]